MTKKLWQPVRIWVRSGIHLPYTYYVELDVANHVAFPVEHGTRWLVRVFLTEKLER